MTISQYDRDVIAEATRLIRRYGYRDGRQEALLRAQGPYYAYWHNVAKTISAADEVAHERGDPRPGLRPEADPTFAEAEGLGGSDSLTPEG